MNEMQMLKPYLVIFSFPGEKLKQRTICHMLNLNQAQVTAIMPGAEIHECRPVRPSDYLGIEYYGNLLGSYRYYIENEQAMAAETGAPLAATHPRWDNGNHRNDYGNWATALDDIPNKDICMEYTAFLAERGYAS